MAAAVAVTTLAGYVMRHKLLRMQEESKEGDGPGFLTRMKNLVSKKSPAARLEEEQFNESKAPVTEHV